MRRVLVMILLIGAASGPHAWAQDTSAPREERPATASYWGDTGLWFVPTAEVLHPKGVSFSIYRTEFDFKQGLSDVSNWPVTLAVGAGPRTEIFGAFRVVTRIDRDARPLFQPTTDAEAGLINDQPFVRDNWTGNGLGDLFLGAKFNVLTEYTGMPLALAFRGTVKAPTADKDKGLGTGEYDYFADVILSKEVVRRFEVTGTTGFAWRGDPENINLSDGWRWGVGAAFGARANVRLTTEVFGEKWSSSEITAAPGVVTGIDGSQSPVVSDLSSGVTTALGLTWQHSSGVSLGAGVTYQSGLEDLPTTEGARGWGMQFRFGFHGGVRALLPRPLTAQGLAPEPPPAPEPVPEPPPPPPPAPVANRQPTIHAQCNPCRIEVGRASEIRADAQDPDGDTLSYRWQTPAGTIVDPRALATTWTAETAPGTVALTVTADDGRGGVASDTINIEVVRAARNLSFDEVHFDFNQATLRPEARTALDRAVRTLNDNPDVQLHIGGHASAEGTPDYNMTLGDRRAHAVRDYLVGHGIAPSRLATETFGETQPKYDNTKEDTRRLNRRAELTAQEPGR